MSQLLLCEGFGPAQPLTVQQFVARFSPNDSALRSIVLCLAMEKPIRFTEGKASFIVLPFDPHRIGQEGRDLLFDATAERDVSLYRPEIDGPPAQIVGPTLVLQP